MTRLLYRILLTLFLFTGLILSNPISSFANSEISEKLNFYKGRVIFYFKSNSDSVEKYSLLGIDLGKKENRNSELVEFFNLLTEQYIFDRKFGLAKEMAKKGYEASLKDKNVDNKAKLGLIYASSLLKNGDLEEGIEQIRENLDLANAHSLTYYQSKNYGFLALLNCGVENQAMCQYFKRKANELKSVSERNKFINNEHMLYLALRKNDLAKVDSIFSSVQQSFLGKENYDSEEVNSAFILGKHFHYAGLYNKSIYIFENLLELELDSEKCMVNEIKALAANAYLFLKKYDKAYKLNEEVKKSIASEPHFRFIDRVLETEALLFEKKGKHKEAVFLWKEYKHVIDSLSNLREKLNAVTVEDIKEFEKTEIKYVHIGRENLEYKMFLSKLEKQRFLLWWFSGLLIILVIISLYLIFKLNKQSRELKENISSVESLNRNLKDSNQIKDKLFSLLGHELRSPIAELVGLLDVKKRLSKMESALPYLNDIHIKSRALYVRLDNILTWSSSELSNRKVENVSLNLDTLIQETIALGAAHIAQKKQKIVYFPQDLWVKGNETQAMIVFRNVLHNSVKFSPVEGEIKIKAIISETFLDLIIEDSGKGFSEEQLEDNLQGIQNSELGTEGEKGSGVGLYISKDLMHKQGGKIFIANTEEGGGRVILRFLR